MTDYTFHFILVYLTFLPLSAKKSFHLPVLQRASHQYDAIFFIQEKGMHLWKSRNMWI